MKKNPIFTKFFLGFCFMLIAGASMACVDPKNEKLHTVETGGGYVFFRTNPVAPEFGGNGQDQDITIYYDDCTGSGEKLVGHLPFLAATGKVVDAFISNVNGSDKLFVIHNVLIGSETQPGDTGDYYSILVFTRTENSYSEDYRLTKYFGKGSDINSTEYEPKPIYTFPYKTRQAITGQIRSENFKHWYNGENLHAVVKNKINIYEIPSIAMKTKMYLIPGDDVILKTIEGGWTSITYQTKKRRKIEGWIPCESLGGC